jgi:hypothetical protein
MSCSISKSSSTGSTRSIDIQVESQESRKVVLCPQCETPMKCLPTERGEQIFYFCSPCDSVRDEFDEDVELALTVRERSLADRMSSRLAFTF